MNTPLSMEQALSAIRVLIPVEFRDTDGTDAIFKLIEETDSASRNSTASWTIDALLDIVERGHPDARMPRYDFLTRALKIAASWIPEKTVANRLVSISAQIGFYGRFPELPQRLLGRNPSEAEVILLVNAYLRERGVRCESTEEKLIKLARAYVPGERARKQIERVEQFAHRWDNDNIHDLS